MPWIEEHETKRGIKYWVCWREGGKKKSQKAGYFKKDAENIRKTIDARLVKNEAGLPQITTLTVKELTEEYQKHSDRTKKKATQDRVKYSMIHFVKHLGARKLENLKPSDLELFRDRMLQSTKKNKKQYEINGVEMVMSQIKSCLNFAVQRGHIRTSPAEKIKKLKAQKVARFLSREEIMRLLQASETNPKLKEFILVALHTGMRLSEVLNIQERDVVNNHVLLSKTKTDTPRLVPIHPYIASFLRAAHPFKGWTKNRLERTFRRAVKRANLGRLRIHDLRHTFASEYLTQGGTLADLMQILGHKQVSTVMIYSHFQKNYLSERLSKVNFLGQILVQEKTQPRTVANKDEHLVNSQNKIFSVNKSISKTVTLG